VSTLNFQPGEQSDPCYTICPYCGAQFGDCDEWVDQTESEQLCDSCGRTYMARADYSVDYITWQTDEEAP